MRESMAAGRKWDLTNEVLRCSQDIQLIVQKAEGLFTPQLRDDLERAAKGDIPESALVVAARQQVAGFEAQLRKRDAEAHELEASMRPTEQ